MEPMKPKQNHKAIGELSEVILIARLLEVGYGILTPLGDNLRYDLVIEDAEEKFWRIQCKTGRSNGEYIEFAPASLYYHTRAGRTTHGSKSYNNPIDYFAVYCPENRAVYLIPVTHAGVS
ncbi:MAG: group I intron-associated PD-(D/E)XK endonuclease [Chloroflexota bacterium]|nr:group I intron-associated PD-(D/E)XK endonuclease [Chloroflexota bacterium]